MSAVTLPIRSAREPKAPEKVYRATDLGNAERLRDRHGANLRFCHPWAKWLVFDGKRWKPDDTGEILRLCKETVREMYADLPFITNDEIRKAMAAWASKSEAAPRLSAMEALARSELPILPNALDANPWLFNCPNGTIDLKSGTLKEHRREDFITKLCPTPFLPDGPSANWDRFLSAIFDGKKEVIEFIRLFFGYSLTGDVREHSLPIFWGTGSNGKSTLLTAVTDTVGEDYAIRLGKEALVVKKQEGHSTERMDLHGKRLAVCSETDDGNRLAESFVKDLTGGDKIRGRRMREDTWEYKPTHKIILPTNHKPEVRGSDHAVWRRLALVPFTQQYWDADKGETGLPELKADKTLPGKLTAEATGILAWMVRGCIDWKFLGLKQPEAVRIATSEYRQSQDVVTAFIDESCIVMEGQRVKAGELYGRYRAWMEAGGEVPVTQRRFGDALTEKGFRRERSSGLWYLGLTTRADSN